MHRKAIGYVHERPDWPRLRWDEGALAVRLARVRHRQGRLLGRMENLGFDLRTEANLVALTGEIVETSAIEGEVLNRGEVRSSVARRLGLDAAGLPRAGRRVEGVVEMMLDATRNARAPLTRERLFGWHAALFPAGRSGIRKISVGAWRTTDEDPMQVVSGPMGRERVHFEAPEASRLEDETTAFLEWFNGPREEDPVLVAAVAHFWFVTIHPFADGNGRIARAVAEAGLARADGCGERFYSMSSQIHEERDDYYRELEIAQRGDVDITGWLDWFLGCLDRAIGRAGETLASVLRKAEFWRTFAAHPLHERQRKVVSRLLDGFEGFLTTSKYARLAGCSPDTALRDIGDLLERGILVKNPARGRSTSYRLAETASIGEGEKVDRVAEPGGSIRHGIQEPSLGFEPPEES